MIAITTSRKRLASMPTPFTPPPASTPAVPIATPVAEDVATPVAVPAAQPDEPPAPSDAAAGVSDAGPIVAALAKVGIPAGLFLSGEVNPAHAAVVLRDHATALGMSASDVSKAVTDALVLLHIIKPDDAQRVASAVGELGDDNQEPANQSSDTAEVAQ